MSKRLTAALAAQLTFAAVLVTVPLVATDPADAHTKTVKRCAYDPFAGQQCWYESVAHVHPPNHYSPPPDTSPRTTADAYHDHLRAAYHRPDAYDAAA
ncbi:MAG: hypothetical protein OXH86_17625 [Acidimicrobiaceae bacterium]|nr:hypothetical protein [Acidimicrobiaceae bacterium]